MMSDIQAKKAELDFAEASHNFHAHCSPCVYCGRVRHLDNGKLTICRTDYAKLKQHCEITSSPLAIQVIIKPCR